MSTTSPAERCLKLYNETYDLEDPDNAGISREGWRRVCIAYRHAMPFLTSDPDAIDAFIACVSQGLILGIFSESEASKLLYAAQTAIASRRARTQSARLQSASTQHDAAPSPSLLALAEELGALHVPRQPDHEASHANPPGKDNQASDKPAPDTLPLCHSVTDTPPPPSLLEPTETLAAPQVPQAGQVPQGNSELQALLDDLYAGKVPRAELFGRVESAVQTLSA